MLAKEISFLFQYIIYNSTAMTNQFYYIPEQESHVFGHWAFTLSSLHSYVLMKRHQWVLSLHHSRVLYVKEKYYFNGMRIVRKYLNFVSWVQYWKLSTTCHRQSSFFLQPHLTNLVHSLKPDLLNDTPKQQSRMTIIGKGEWIYWLTSCILKTE